MKKILGVKIGNFIIYIIGVMVSSLLIGLYFIDHNKPGWILCCSIGASGIGAVLLAYFIDLGANQRENKILKRYIDSLKFTLARGYCEIINCIQKQYTKTIYSNETKLSDVLNEKFENLLRQTQNKYPIYKNKQIIDISQDEKSFVNSLKFQSRMGNLAIEINDIFSHRYEFISNGYFDKREIDSLWIMNLQLIEIQSCERAYEILNHLLEFYALDNIPKLKLDEFTLIYNAKRKCYEVKNNENKKISF